MRIEEVNLIVLKRARPWALNIILGLGSPRYTEEQLKKKTQKELAAEAKSLVLEFRKAPNKTGRWNTQSANKDAAWRKKQRILRNVMLNCLSVEQADELRLKDDALYELWSDEWFDLDMQFALKGVRSSDIQ